MKKITVGIIIGIVLTTSINIVGASISSSGVIYNSKTLNTVLDDLYSKINIGDAASNQILSGKTALVKGTKITGTMANQSALTHAISVGSNGTNKYFRIPTGAYLTLQSTGYPEIYASATEIDSNIKAENIKKGVSIAGITGTYEGSNTYNSFDTLFSFEGTSSSDSTSSGYTTKTYSYTKTDVSNNYKFLIFSLTLPWANEYIYGDYTLDFNNDVKLCDNVTIDNVGRVAVHTALYLINTSNLTNKTQIFSVKFRGLANIKLYGIK